LNELRDHAISNWGLLDVAVVHRIGRVDLGEASVAIAVASEHRAAAFDAGRWLIDTLKEQVPIWKKEVWSDGSTEWVHPDTTQS
jgi:molybdopterin synthase catalytic subunit